MEWNWYLFRYSAPDIYSKQPPQNPPPPKKLYKQKGTPAI